jgi:predicted ATPase/DNA-binding SARP family transcriptional activator
MISVLGPLQVLHDGEVVDIGSPRHREVLAALVVDAGRVVPTETLLERVWGEGRGGTTANLHAVISRLRSRLREAGEDAEIATAAPGYRLDAPGTIDAEVFQRRCQEARSLRADGDLPAARSRLDEALGMWRDRAYADVLHPCAEAEAARLDGLRLAAHEQAAELDLALGRTEPVLDRVPALVAEHPLRESLRGLLMLALYRAGRQAEALDVYAEGRRVLAEELGLDPGPELATLHQRILEQDEGLLGPTPSTAPASPAPSRVPAPSEPGAWSSEVVVPPTALLGRARDVEYVVGLLADSTERLVTVTGVGGVGKTRLAYAVAEASRDRFRDGVAVVSLAPLTDPATVLPAVGRATGLPSAEGSDPAAVTEHLRHREMLVVLDNAEHLPDAAGGIGRLVASCPGLTVLVTSRTPLRVRGELQYQLAPLGLPEPGAAAPGALEASSAAALFLERARSVSPGFVLDDGNAASVGAICRRLAGIPLALELAAARTRMLSPRAILERLDQVMAAGGARDLPPRQRTMRAAIGWSYQLLTEDEQRLFRVLAVFVDGFTLEAVEAVAGPDGVLEDLEALVEHSLALPDPEHADVARFRMLEPVHQYAVGLLSGDEEDEVRLAHLRYFLEVAEATEPSYRGPGTAEAMALTQREHANFVAALEWGAKAGHAELAGRLAWALWLFWWIRGNVLEGRRLLQTVLAEELTDGIRARALAAHGAMAYAQGDLVGSRAWFEGADVARRTGDLVGLAHNLAGVGLVALAEEDLEAAEQAVADTIPLCEEAGNGGGWLWTLAHVWLATIRVLRGATSEAEPLLDLALAAAREREDPLAIYITLFTSAQVALARNDVAGARGQLEEGIRLSERTGDLANLAYFLDTLGVVEAIENAPHRVAVLHGAAQRLRETVGSNVYGYYKPDEAMLESSLESARTALGEDFEAAVAQGRALSVTDTLELALRGD